MQATGSGWNNSRVSDKFLGTLHEYIPGTFAAHSPPTMFAREFLSPFGKTTLRESKVLQSVSTILSEAVVVKDITGVVSAQTSSRGIFTVETSCKCIV